MFFAEKFVQILLTFVILGFHFHPFDSQAIFVASYNAEILNFAIILRTSWVKIVPLSECSSPYTPLCDESPPPTWFVSCKVRRQERR